MIKLNNFWIFFLFFSFFLSCNYTQIKTPAIPVPSSSPVTGQHPTIPTPDDDVDQGPLPDPSPILITGSQSIRADLPQLLDTTYTEPTGAIIRVPSGGNLQNALNSVQCGQVVELEAKAKFTGSFWLNKKCPSNSRIVIRSSAYRNLPAPGIRVSSSDKDFMAKLETNDLNAGALSAGVGASGYRVIGLEITTANNSSTATQYVLASFGVDVYGNEATALSQLPDDIILDRVYIHGTDNGAVRRGVLANSKALAIIDSYISNIHEAGADNQAICGWSGPGPFKIVNNYLEAAGENVMFGGASSYSAQFIPSDLEFRYNVVTKPVSWKGSRWTVKNNFELKDMQRALIEGNVFGPNWAASQNGFAFLLTVRNDGGSQTWQTVEHITAQNNIIRDAPSAINIGVRDDYLPSQPAKNIAIRNNLFYNINTSAFPGDGSLIQIVGGPGRKGFNFEISHNTMLHSIQQGRCLMLASQPVPIVDNIIYRDNICTMASTGFHGDGAGFGATALASYFEHLFYDKNLLIGNKAGPDQPGSIFVQLPAQPSDSQFVDEAAKNYRLKSSSLGYRQATDGTDVGIDMDLIDAHTAKAIQGR